MTKNEELVWRLKERPSAEGVSRLVEQKVITSEEARALLFSKKNPSEEIEALKEQVEFFKGLVENLSKQRTTITSIPYTHVIKTPTPYWSGITTWAGSSTNGTVLCATNSVWDGKKKKEWTELKVQ